MRINFIKTDFNTYIEVGGDMIGYFSRRYNNNLKCIFFQELALSLDELGQIYDKMEELNGT
jgi:hypothetical protein